MLLSPEPRWLLRSVHSPEPGRVHRSSGPRSSRFAHRRAMWPCATYAWATAVRSDLSPSAVCLDSRPSHCHSQTREYGRQAGSERSLPRSKSRAPGPQPGPPARMRCRAARKRTTPRTLLPPQAARLLGRQEGMLWAQNSCLLDQQANYGGYVGQKAGTRSRLGNAVGQPAGGKAKAVSFTPWRERETI